MDLAEVAQLHPTATPGAGRAAALERSGLLEAQAEEAFDRLTRLAARLTGASVAVLNLTTDDRLHVKSAQSADGPIDVPQEIPLAHAFWREVIRTDGHVCSADTRADDRFDAFPLTRARDHAGAYAGVPVRDGNGQCLGTLCVTRPQPHLWPEHACETLQALADLITTELNLRALASEACLRSGELESLESIVEAAQNAIIGKRLDGTIIYWSSGAERLYGYSRSEALGQSIKLLAATPDQATEFDEIHARVARGENLQLETTRRRRDGSTVNVEVSVSPLIDGSGHIIGASTSATDITSRLQAQQAERRLARLLAEAQEISAQGSWERDVSTGDAVWTDQMYTIFGVTPSSSGTHDAHQFRALIHPDDYDAYLAMLRHVERSGTPAEAEFRIVRADGDMRLLLARAHLNRSVDGDKLVGTTQDVTAQRALEHEATAARNLFSGVLDAATETLIFSTDANGLITVFNRGAEQMLGYSAEEVIGVTTPERFHDPAEVVGRAEEMGIAPGFDVFVHAARAGRAENRIWTLVRRDRSTLTASLTITATYDSQGRPTGFIGVAVDITKAHAAELARRAAEHRFQAAFEHAPIGVALIDLRGSRRGCFLQTNPALARLLGREPGDLDGLSIEELTHSAHEVPSDRLDRIYMGDIVSDERRLVHADGRELWVMVSCTPVPAEDGSGVEYAVAQIVDISERRRFEKQLRHLADHDPLTGLYNRHRFEQELDRVVSETRLYGRRAALLVLDLDGFKSVNDRFGHPVGDELVSRIGGLLCTAVRTSDVVARLGGDEFAIILQEAGDLEAVIVADSILEAIRQRGLVVRGERHARVTTSIGITTFDRRCTLSGEELIVEADIAMYDAKSAGRNGHAVYDRATNRRATDSKQHAWLERLPTAVDNDLFELHAQQILDISGSGTLQFELLLRMRDESGELILPSAFLDNAERFNLMGDIDRWVLRRAVKLLYDHHQAGNELTLAVNLSGRTMDDVALPNDLAEILAEFPIPEGRLIIELTETAAIVNIDRARQLARDLRQLGCRFALDDFGAGFASFYYLKHLAFDYLKIDGEFIKKLTTTPTDQLVVRAVVEIAKGLDTATVAEFVGDQETLEMLREMGVDYGQGFFLGRPGPLSDQLPPLHPRPEILGPSHRWC